MSADELLGRGIAFPPRLGPDGRWAWSVGIANVRESISVILRTELGERIMLPEFGAGLGGLLEEPNSLETRRRIADRIKDALTRWERRIRVEAVTVEADPDDPRAARAVIRYALVATSSREQVALRLATGGSG